MQSEIFSDVKEVKTSNDKIAAELALKRLERELQSAIQERAAIENTVEPRTNEDALAFLATCAISGMFGFAIYGAYRLYDPLAPTFGVVFWLSVLVVILFVSIVVYKRNKGTKQHIKGVGILKQEYDRKIGSLKREIFKQKKIVEG